MRVSLNQVPSDVVICCDQNLSLNDHVYRFWQRKELLFGVSALLEASNKIFDDFNRGLLFLIVSVSPKDTYPIVVTSTPRSRQLPFSVY